MLKHELYTLEDFTEGSHDEGLAEKVINGGLAICKKCGKAETELDGPCESPLTKQYRLLADGLSDMVESGRLTNADIPDDYRWLVESLAPLATTDPEEIAEVKMVEPPDADCLNCNGSGVVPNPIAGHGAFRYCPQCHVIKGPEDLVEVKTAEPITISQCQTLLGHKCNPCAYVDLEISCESYRKQLRGSKRFNPEEDLSPAQAAWYKVQMGKMTCREFEQEYPVEASTIQAETTGAHS